MYNYLIIFCFTLFYTSVFYPRKFSPKPDPDPLTGGLQSIGTTSAKADKVRNITVNIEKLIDRFEVNTTNLREDMSRVKELVAEAVLSAVNDVNLAM